MLLRRRRGICLFRVALLYRPERFDSMRVRLTIDVLVHEVLDPLMRIRQTLLTGVFVDLNGRGQRDGFFEVGLQFAHAPVLHGFGGHFTVALVALARH